MVITSASLWLLNLNPDDFSKKSSFPGQFSWDSNYHVFPYRDTTITVPLRVPSRENTI